MAREEPRVLYQGAAEGNAVVVQRLLREHDVVVSCGPSSAP
jgi:hypothetical protein